MNTFVTHFDYTAANEVETETRIMKSFPLFNALALLSLLEKCESLALVTLVFFQVCQKQK